MDIDVPALKRRAALGLEGAAFPAAAATVLAWLVWSGLDGGFSPTVWGSVGAGIVLLLGVALATIPGAIDLRDPFRLVAVAALVAFCGWSFASILWADFPGDAWAGSAVTLAYAAGFLLMSLWPLSPRSATTLLALFVFGVVVAGALTLIGAALDDQATARWFVAGRLFEPVGYPNGTVALWTSALWPALALAAQREIPLPGRALALGSAGFLLELAVLGQSRGWLIFFPLSLGVALLLTRQRLRLLLAVALACAAAAAVAAPLLDVFEAFDAGRDPHAAVVRAARLIGVSVALLTLAGGAWAWIDHRLVLSRSVHRALGGVAVAAVLLVVVGSVAGALVAAEHPGRWVSERWEEFTGGKSLETDGSRFASSASSGRYEEWKVAWKEFVDHPVTGIGADNFAAAYLEQRDNDFREPRFPHSLELKLLSQLGLVGVLLFLAFSASAVVLALRRRRRLGPAEGSIVGATLMVPAWWAIAGSADWFWEIPALAGPAFGFLGLAGAIRAGPAASGPDPTERRRRPTPTSADSASRRPQAMAGSEPGESPLRERRRPAVTAPYRALLAVAAIAAAIAGAASLAFPALSDAYLRSGLGVWKERLPLAYARLGRAASLNPLSGSALLVEGSIALRVGNLDAAERAFLAALEREPRNWYAYLQLALISATQGEREEAWARLRQAQELNPNDKVARRLQTLLERGKSVDPNELNDRYLRSFTQRLSEALRSPSHGVRSESGVK